MNLIARRKKQHRANEALGHLGLVVRALIAQRVARKAYSGYKWTRRMPYILGGAAVVAFVVRKTQQKSGGAPDAGFTPAPTTSSTSAAGAAEPAAPTPSTPTPTGSPTAVTPAPTAAAGDAPKAADKDAEAKDAEAKDAEAKR